MLRKIQFKIIGCLVPVLALVFVMFQAAPVVALIDGITGQTEFFFTAKADRISTVDGGSYLFWGYGDDENHALNGGRAQYPGPVLMVNEGQMVTIHLTNQLADPVSIVFPGQLGITATGGQPGLVTQEATLGGGEVVYSFVANEPGTYLYYSGTKMELQVEMGLVGVIIIRPAMGANYAYNSASTKFDHEFLFFLSEMDPEVHNAMEHGLMGQIENSRWWPVYWMINGRTAPDNMSEAFAPWLKTQPYNSVPRMHPGETLLMRVVGGGRDLHPFHHHGNHASIIAKDGRLLSTDGVDPDLATAVFTIQSVPGQTVDALFDWTGEGLNWDIYGTPADGMPDHDCIDNVINDSAGPPYTAGGDGYSDPDDAVIPGTYPWEYCVDHNKPFPVTLPNNKDLFFGGWYGGSPFLGALGDLPPGEGGLNPNGGFSFMWHSHTEKELANFDIFPGGMLDMLIVEPWGVVIP
ncbi:MAG: multicopper oxidase domain-containing protein [Bacteroidia bacterium]|nr:multicopper oxidase domain-containing protein [Bacteroidia bacterium]